MSGAIPRTSGMSLEDLYLGLDRSGKGYIVQKPSGFGTAESRSKTIDRVGAHGASTTRGFYSARPWAFGGLITASTREQRERFEQDIADRMDPDSKVALVFHRATGTRYSIARPLKFTPVQKNGLVSEFTIALVAEDPFLYGGDPRVMGDTGWFVAATGLPSSSGGLTWPATWPATWSGTQVSGEVDVPTTGAGLLDVTLKGPLVNPRIRWSTTDGRSGEVAWSSLSLSSEERLVLRNFGGDGVASPVWSPLLQGQAARWPNVAQFPPLAPGLTLSFSDAGGDPSARMTVNYLPGYGG